MTSPDRTEPLPMRVRPVDIVWLTVAGFIAAGMVLGVVSLFREFVLPTLIGLPFAGMVALGAWKRTKWGAPAGGLREHQERRKQQRRSGQMVDPAA